MYIVVSVEESFPPLIRPQGKVYNKSDVRRIPNILFLQTHVPLSINITLKKTEKGNYEQQMNGLDHAQIYQYQLNSSLFMNIFIYLMLPGHNPKGCISTAYFFIQVEQLQNIYEIGFATYTNG